MSVQQRHQRVRLALDDAREKILSLCSGSVDESLSLGVKPEALEAILSPIRQLVISCFDGLNREAPLIHVSDSWNTEQLQKKMSELREELLIHRRRISRHKSQFFFLADRYRRLRTFHEAFKENYWKGFREVIFQLQTKGISTQFLNRYANEHLDPDENLSDDEKSKPKDWFMEFDEDLDGVQMLDEEEVAAQITEAVLKARHEERSKQQALEEEIHLLNQCHSEEIAKAVEEAVSKYKEDKIMFGMIKIEYENRIDELQQQLETTKNYVTERMEKVKQVRERTLQGITRELQSAQMDTDGLKSTVDQLEEEIANLRESEELLKLDVLNATMAHKKDSFQMRKQIQVLRAKVEEAEPPDVIALRATKPLAEKINSLENTILELKSVIQTLKEEKLQERENFTRSEKLLEAQVAKFDESHSVVKTVSAKLLRAEKEVSKLAAELFESRTEKDKLIDKLSWQSELAERLKEGVSILEKQLKEAERRTGFVAKKVSKVSLPKDLPSPENSLRQTVDSPNTASVRHDEKIPSFAVERQATATQTDPLLTKLDAQTKVRTRNHAPPALSITKTPRTVAPVVLDETQRPVLGMPSVTISPTEALQSIPEQHQGDPGGEVQRTFSKEEQQQRAEQKDDESKLRNVAKMYPETKDQASQTAMKDHLDSSSQTEPKTVQDVGCTINERVFHCPEIEVEPNPHFDVPQTTDKMTCTRDDYVFKVSEETSVDAAFRHTVSRATSPLALLSSEVQSTQDQKGREAQLVHRDMSTSGRAAGPVDSFLTTKSIFQSVQPTPRHGGMEFLSIEPRNTRAPQLLDTFVQRRPLGSEERALTAGTSRQTQSPRSISNPETSNLTTMTVSMDRAVQTEVFIAETSTNEGKSIPKLPQKKQLLSSFLRVQSASNPIQRGRNPTLPRSDYQETLRTPHRPSPSSIPQQHRVSSRSLSLVPASLLK